MHMDRRFALIVTFSLVWGLVVSLLFYRIAAHAQSPAPEKSLVVAAQPLPPGASIAAEAVKIVRVPEKLFPHGGFSKVEDVVGRPVVSSIQPDEPVVEARIAPRGSGFGVAPMIPSGMRALAVRVNDVAGVAGFVLPGARVDVLVTGRPPGADDTVTTPVLEDVAVLSAGQTVEADSHSQSMSVAVVTLLVTPAQSVSLTLAASEGKIQLVLRNSGDRQVIPTPGRELRELYGQAVSRPRAPVDAAPAPAAPRRAPPPVAARAIPLPSPAAVATESMILLRGAQKSVETFPGKVARP
jgi:pilus assembly protein CpaB